MNRQEISYGSPEETRAAETRHQPISWGLRQWYDQKMEEYDPDGQKAYEIAKKHVKREGENG
jgi:hypothetical protein